MEIYAVNILNKLDAKLYMRLLSLVDSNKNIRIRKYKNIDDKIRILTADVLIRSLVCSRLHISNHEIEYEYNHYGKPMLKHVKQFNFNISHSGAWVVAAVDMQPIGIDIEKVCSLDYGKIAKRFFSNTEYKWLFSQNISERLKCFYKLWTLKESYIKKIGKGLSIPLDIFSININEKGESYMQDDKGLEKNLNFKTEEINDNYIFSVCSNQISFTHKLTIKDYEELYNMASI